MGDPPILQQHRVRIGAADIDPDPPQLHARVKDRDRGLVRAQPGRGAASVSEVGAGPAVRESSTLDAAHRQAGGHAAAEHVIGRDRRHSVDDRGRHHIVPRRHVTVEERSERHGDGHAPIIRQQQELVKVFVPRQQ